MEDLIEEEECVFTLTAAGYIKRTPVSAYKAQRRGGKGITAQTLKDEDYVETVFTASTHDFILFFTNKGRVHRKKGYQIAEAGRTAKGTYIGNVLPVEQDEKVTAMIHLREFPEDRYLVMVTRNGTVKRIQLSAINTARKAGIRCITLDEGDDLICVRETDGEQCILIATHDGMAICFLENDVRCMGRDACGVRGINLRPGDYVIGAARAKYDHQVLMVTENGYGKRTLMDEYIRADGPQKRGGFGLKGYQVTDCVGRHSSSASSIRRSSIRPFTNRITAARTQIPARTNKMIERVFLLIFIMVLYAEVVRGCNSLKQKDFLIFGRYFQRKRHIKSYRIKETPENRDGTESVKGGDGMPVAYVYGDTWQGNGGICGNGKCRECLAGE